MSSTTAACQSCAGRIRRPVRQGCGSGTRSRPAPATRCPPPVSRCYFRTATRSMVPGRRRARGQGIDGEGVVRHRLAAEVRDHQDRLPGPPAEEGEDLGPTAGDRLVAAGRERRASVAEPDQPAGDQPAAAGRGRRHCRAPAAIDDCRNIHLAGRRSGTVRKPGGRSAAHD